MNRTIIAAALSLASVVAPVAAHADSFHEGRGTQRVEFRQDGDRDRDRVATTPVYAQPVYSQPVYSQPVYSQPVYAQPVYAPRTVAVRRIDHDRDGWRMERGHAIQSGRVRFEHGRR